VSTEKINEESSAVQPQPSLGEVSSAESQQPLPVKALPINKVTDILHTISTIWLAFLCVVLSLWALNYVLDTLGNIRSTEFVLLIHVMRLLSFLILLISSFAFWAITKKR
jgi:hypothetical protein